MTEDTEDTEDAECTPRVCASCGGRGCRWCTRGYQDAGQQRAWSKHRERMRKISSTYSLLEKIVRELIDGLDSIGDKELADQGRECLNTWLGALSDTEERREAGMRISLFQSQAVIALIRARTSGP